MHADIAAALERLSDALLAAGNEEEAEVQAACSCARIHVSTGVCVRWGDRHTWTDRGSGSGGKRRTKGLSGKAIAVSHSLVWAQDMLWRALKVNEEVTGVQSVNVAKTLEHLIVLLDKQG